MRLFNLFENSAIERNYNFENMVDNIKDSNCLIINTLDSNNQNCLILNTLSIDKEIELLNKYIKTNREIKIIIYGKNSYDNSVLTKYKQLKNLGFNNIYIYTGGLFEWLLLQEVYGEENFPTTTNEIDILKYK